MSKNKKINETAAAGAVGAHSVAVRFDSKERDDYPTKKRVGGFLDFMQRNNKKITNRLQMKEIKTPYNISLKENVSLDQIYSKLSGIQNQGRMNDDNTETYGVEDDDGNLMKITVRGDQQEEFEAALARELAEIEEYKMTGRGGHGRNVSMAEVLYNLKQDFDIVNVEFPEIPKDKVYNADKVSDPDEVDTDLPDPEENIGNAEMGDESELDDLGGDAEGDEFGDMGDAGEEGEEGEAGEEEEDLGQDFGEEKEDEESILKSIVRMLSSEAEARRAQYEAEVEKSKALQAKYSMMAAKGEAEKQEDIMRMESEMEKQKKKEKEAKKMADLARFKMSGSVEENFKEKSFGEFMVGLMELDDLDNETTLRLQRREVQKMEDPVEKRLRQQSLNSDRRLIKHREQKEKEEQRKQEEEDREEQKRERENARVGGRV
jgi:hypothetical protein